jgi:hypothetical protein
MAAPVTNVRDGTPIAILPCRHAGDRKFGLGGAIDVGLRSLDLQKDLRDVIVLFDGDEAGEGAAPRLCPALQARGPARSHRSPATGAGLQEMLQRPAPRNEESAQ